ncbi:hypothetical protein CSUI_010396, partial [Cystoisospora suis]
ETGRGIDKTLFIVVVACLTFDGGPSFYSWSSSLPRYLSSHSCESSELFWSVWVATSLAS